MKIHCSMGVGVMGAKDMSAEDIGAEDMSVGAAVECE